MATALDVANVFLKLSDPDAGDVLTNLKLQKLVYYAQGFHLAMSGKPLFGEDIEAWQHGPVVQELYDELKQYVSNPVPIPEDFDASQVFTDDQLSIIKEVNQVYGQFSAWKLRDMTHNESPWKSTQQGDVITTDKLRSYFVTQLI